MKQINLLSRSVQKQERLKKLATSSCIALVLALGFCAGLRTVVDDDKKILSEGIERKKAFDSALVNAQVANAETIEDGDLRQRITQINTLAANEIDWNKALDLVGSSVPKDIRLTSYSYAAANGIATLKMTGEAPTNLSFAVFVESLRGSKSFTSVKVDSFVYNVAKGSVNFALSVTMSYVPLLYGGSK